MKFFNQPMNVVLAALFVLAVCFLPFRARGSNLFHDFIPVQTTFSCNDLIHVSLDENCQALILPAHILEGEPLNTADFAVQLFDDQGNPIPNPVTGTYVGQAITVKAIHTPSDNSCWGRALIEDKSKPSITCVNANIPCFQNLAAYPLPVAADNCATPTVLLTNQVIDASDRCSGVTIARTFVAIDNQGNVSAPCTQVLTTVPPPLPDFPEDKTWACEVYNQHQNVIAAQPLTGVITTTGSGVPDMALGVYCPYSVNHSDVHIPGCGNSFSIIRTWAVLNWCTGQLVLVDKNGDDNIQIIKVADDTPPMIALQAFTVGITTTSQHPHECLSTGFLPPPAISDNCSSWTVRIFTTAGEADYVNGADGAQGGNIPFPGLPLGVHPVTYKVVDACGNTGAINVDVTVTDQTAPVTICDEITSVTLDNTGFASVLASALDDGSYDNCCLDTFLIRRMANICDPADTLFAEEASFCCNDAGSRVTVVVRAIDCSGNFNECMVSVEVEDKIKPVLVSCPPPQTISCNFYSDSLFVPLSQGDNTILARFGTPVFKDNCGLVFLENTFSQNIDQCLKGEITRTWKVTDPSNSGEVPCSQVISVGHISNWAVQFPNDLTVNCTETLPATGGPTFFFDDCELVAVSFLDEVFTVVPDVCFKIARTWVVINWCQVGDVIDEVIIESSETVLDFDINKDGNKDDRTFQDGLNTGNFNPMDPLNGAQPDGYIRYQQTIKVIDNVKPVVNCQPEIDICILGPECTATVSLPSPFVLDCSSQISITAYGQLGTGLGPFANIPIGAYSMVYVVRDNCGNSTACETEVVVRDCKKPTPICINGLSVTLEEDTTVTIFADGFDAGSFDNCPGNLTYSFTPLITTSTMSLDCFSLGFVSVDIWLTDSNGNQDYCTTFVFVDDNNRTCQGAPLIGGIIKTEMDVPVPKVHVKFNDPPITLETDGAGAYSFEAQMGMGYSVCPTKDNFLLNGVTTFDIVLISRHILGLQLLDSPYKIIAADVNNSGAVTTADLVALRKLILQMSDSFPNNASWRFVDKSYTFPNPSNPFTEPFPELMNIGRLNNDYLQADFVAIKIGDVNYSALP